MNFSENRTTDVILEVERLDLSFLVMYMLLLTSILTYQHHDHVELSTMPLRPLLGLHLDVVLRHPSKRWKIRWMISNHLSSELVVHPREPQIKIFI